MTSAPAPDGGARTPFHDIEAYAALPRVVGLHTDPHGSRLVAEVSLVDPEKKGRTGSLWWVDPAGERPARRLTRSPKGEAFAGFSAGGVLWFWSSRPDAADAPGAADDAPDALWALPPDGEAVLVSRRAGGFDTLGTARDSPVVAVLAPTLPGTAAGGRAGDTGGEAPGDVASAATGAEQPLDEAADDRADDGADDRADDDARRKRRTDTGTTAILHEAYPVRMWDHDLGPDAPRLLTATLDEAALAALDDLQLPVHPGPGSVAATGDGDPRPDPPAPARGPAWRDLTGHVGHALRGAHLALDPEGRTALLSWDRHEGRGSMRTGVVAVDLATGARRQLLDDPDHEFWSPVVSPDGTRVAVLVSRRLTPEDPGETWAAVAGLPAEGALALADLRDVAPGWDRWPESVCWTPDGRSLLLTADDGGRRPVFRAEVPAGPGDGGGDAPAGPPLRLTPDDGCYEFVGVGADRSSAYALRSAVDSAPVPVRIDLGSGAGGSAPVALRGPLPALEVPGTLSEVHAVAADGTPLRAWLALPEAPATAGGGAADPAPLLVWFHGGPLASWNDWTWRWNPWLMTARGWAVLMPDYALSTGYGHDFVARGWGDWGGAPFTDSMALVDAALERPDVSADKVSVMGGSFGGYLVNWVLGHTDRFAAAVTHASIYALDQFGATTDVAFYWAREMTREAADAASPHHHVGRWTTPTLVVHGDRDYRVPVGDGLRLWWDLARTAGREDGTMPHKFLYFPDENHWVLKPQHVVAWYRTVWAFLDHHVKGVPWRTPDLLQ